MMKRIIIVAAVVALVSSSAMAASLVVIQPLGTAVSSQGRAITNDGQYVIGHGPGGVADRAFLWTAAGGTQGPMLAGSFMSEGTGVGYRTNPTTLAKELLIGGKQSSAQVGMFRSTDNGVTWTRPLQSAGTGPGTAATNSVGGNAVGSADYGYMGWTDSGAATMNYLGSVWGDPISSAITQKNNSGTQTAYSNGMSNTGRMVGARKNNSGQKQNCYQVVGTQTLFAGLDGTNVGLATSVSGNGIYIFGQSPIVGSGTTNYPYMKNVVSGAITPLTLLPGTTGSVSLGYPYGASEDGRWAGHGLPRHGEGRPLEHDQRSRHRPDQLRHR